MLHIDPEFKSLLQPLIKEEYAQLEQNLIADGCREPLVTWNDIIIDGHNRYEICTKNMIDFKVAAREFTDREAVKDWIDKNQLGRRNLSPEQMGNIRGRVFNRKKKPGGLAWRKDLVQNEPAGDAAEMLAKEFGVSASTIKRDGQFASAIETLKPIADIETKIQQKEKVNRQDVIKAAEAVKTGDVETAKEILNKGTAQIKKEASVMHDEAGNEIPEEYKPLFIAAKQFDKWLQILTDLDKSVTAVQKEPAFAWLPKKVSFDPTLRRLREIIRNAKPYAICPDCKGLKCKNCHDSGVVIKSCYVKEGSTNEA